MFRVTTFQGTCSYPAMADKGSVDNNGLRPSEANRKELQPSHTSRHCVNNVDKSLSRAANRHEVSRKSHMKKSNRKLDDYAYKSMDPMNQPQQPEHNHDRDLDDVNEANIAHEATRGQETRSIHDTRSAHPTHETHFTRPTTTSTTRPTRSRKTLTTSTLSERKHKDKREKPVTKPLTLSYAINQLVSPTQALSPAELQPHLYRVEKQPCLECQEAKEARRRRKWKRWPLSWVGFVTK